MTAQAEAAEIIRMVMAYKLARRTRDETEAGIRLGEVTGKAFMDAMHAETVAAEAFESLTDERLAAALRLLAQQPALESAEALREEADALYSEIMPPREDAPYSSRYIFSVSRLVSALRAHAANIEQHERNAQEISALRTDLDEARAALSAAEAPAGRDG